MAEHTKQADAPEKIQFHYQKSPGYRTIHADGAVGGSTARGYLAITFYNERGTIPRIGSREVIQVDEDQVKLGRETIEDSLKGIMRQLETTVMLDVNASRELLVWLHRHVAVLEEELGIPPDQRVDLTKRKVDGE